MVKVCEDLFPEGSYKGQKSAGFYMDGLLKDNIDILVESIGNDMQFLGLVCASTYGVRTGKSTIVQHVGTYFTNEVNKKYGCNNTFTNENIFFKSKKMIEFAQTCPKYSFLVLDEGDDLTEHAFSKVLKDLKKFLRKCGQLNLFIIVILPDFFEMPRGIAVSRSNFLIDVKFQGKFDRGYFDFYNFKAKKKLYLKGKKNNDYDVQEPNFSGRFIKLYTVDEKEYRAKKEKDIEQDAFDEDAKDFPRQHGQRNALSLILKKVFGMTYKEQAETLKKLGEDVAKSRLGEGAAKIWKKPQTESIINNILGIEETNSREATVTPKSEIPIYSHSTQVFRGVDEIPSNQKHKDVEVRTI